MILRINISLSLFLEHVIASNMTLLLVLHKINRTLTIGEIRFNQTLNEDRNIFLVAS